MGIPDIPWKLQRFQKFSLYSIEIPYVLCNILIIIQKSNLKFVYMVYETLLWKFHVISMGFPQILHWKFLDTLLEFLKFSWNIPANPYKSYLKFSSMVYENFNRKFHEISNNPRHLKKFALKIPWNFAGIS